MRPFLACCIAELDTALLHGGSALPPSIRAVMRATARFMTSLSYRV